MDRMDDKLQSLWSEYRDACPDPEPGPNFMPEMWRRIDSRRRTATLLYRRWAEVFVMTTFAITVLLVAFLIPRYQREAIYEATYVDVLNAADSTFDAMILPSGDVAPGDFE